MGGDEPLPRFPFTALISCLTLAESTAERISDWIRLELSTLFINTKKQAEDIEYLAARVNEHASFIADDGDVAALFGTQKNRTILVAGAGPTLSTNMTLLSELHQKHPLIAVDAALTPLVNNGIHPEYTVTIDPQAAIAELFFTSNISKLTDKTLIYFPTVHTNVLTSWHGPRCAAYTHGRVYRQMKEDLPRGELFSAGSVIHPAIDLAVKMGGTTILLFGADFSFPNQATHADGCAINQPLSPPRNSEKSSTAMASTSIRSPTSLVISGTWKLILPEIRQSHSSMPAGMEHQSKERTISLHDSSRQQNRQPDY